MPEHLYRLPPEIVEYYIIDHLHDDKNSLKNCSLVSRSWVPRTRQHLFNEIGFWGPRKLEAWKRTFPNPAVSPAHHVRSLSVPLNKVDATDYSRWIKSFDCITRLEVHDFDQDCSKHQMNVCHGLSKFVKSLRVFCNSSAGLSKFLAFVCSYPSLEDLEVKVARFTDEIDEDEATFQPSTSPLFTGTLKLNCHLEDITSSLLDLPGGLRFKKIVWKVRSPVGELGLQPVMALVERCSDTLECIDIDLKRHLPTTPINLSHAIKLKEVVFWLERGNVVWIAESLATVTSRNKYLQRVSVHFHDRFVSQNSKEVRERFKDLDIILVQLWKSRAICTKLTFYDTWGDQDGFAGILLPEATKTGAIELVS